MTVRSITVRLGATMIVTAVSSAAMASGAGSAFLGPTPYLSAADSPFDLLSAGCLYALEDFESGALTLPGVVLSAGAIKGPSPTTDSVDADTGAIDGNGNNAHSWAVNGGILNIFFDETVLGGFPTEVGIVWTDGFPSAGVTFVAIDFQGNLIGSTVNTLGDEFDNGTTAEDRFLGIVHPPGISAISIIPVLGGFEVDHLQFKWPVPPSQVQFYGPSPYLSSADGPFGILRPGLAVELEDFEDGVADPHGVDINFKTISGPGGLTDSVDADTGAIDGSGTNGRSVLKSNTLPLIFKFDPTILGGYPTRFGLVITDLASGPQPFTMNVYGPTGCLLGQHVFEIAGDGVFNGTTDEDRFIGAEHAAGISRVDIIAPSTAFEYDHVQYDLPIERDIAFLGPRPYLSAQDSLFDLSGVGFDFALEDFESGAIQAPGLSVNFSSIGGPGGLSDSVDADTGVIDGSGTNARAALVLANPLVLDWNAGVLGGLPTQVGLVITDMAPGNIPFTVTAFDENLQPIGSAKTYFIIGDGVFNGTTAEDRFIGVESAIGIRRLTVARPSGGMEVDHIQYNLPSPIADPFGPAQPYLSSDDSPLMPIVLGDENLVLYLETFETGSWTLPGTTINLDLIQMPGPTTDSVDADTGAIDGFGNNARSAIKFAGAPLVIAFNAAILGEYPIAAGLVWTDCGPGIANVTLEAFDADGVLIGEKTYYSLGDNVDNGATDEDRYLGLEHAGGISELRLTSNRLIEFDHVQFVGPKVIIGPLVGDINGDGWVDGADLGLLLFNWGKCEGCPADLNGDGVIDGADLGLLLSNWLPNLDEDPF